MHKIFVVCWNKKTHLLKRPLDQNFLIFLKNSSYLSFFCGLLFDSVLLRESVLSYCLKGQLEMIYYFIETQFMGRSYFIAFQNNLKQIDGKVLNFCQIGERTKMPWDNLEDCIICDSAGYGSAMFAKIQTIRSECTHTYSKQVQSR